MPRPLRAALAVSLLSVLLVTACADEDPVTVTPVDPGGGSSEAAPDPSSPDATDGASEGSTDDAAGVAQLDLVVDDGAGNRVTRALTCTDAASGSWAPEGETTPVEPVCTLLAEQGATALAPVPEDQMCTMIYGGPQTATVTGTVGGEVVDASFDRTDGCEVDRWDALAPLLGAVDS